MQKIDNLIKERPILVWIGWLIFTVTFLLVRILFYYHNSVVSPKFFTTMLFFSLLIPALLLFYWHSSLKDEMFSPKNFGLLLIGMVIFVIAAVFPMFFDINCNVEDRCPAEIKVKLQEKIIDYDSGLYVLYFSPEQLTKTIEKYNEEYLLTEKTEIEEREINKKAREQDILKALTNVKEEKHD
jgi:hypothetical protein